MPRLCTQANFVAAPPASCAEIECSDGGTTPAPSTVVVGRSEPSSGDDGFRHGAKYRLVLYTQATTTAARTTTAQEQQASSATQEGHRRRTHSPRASRYVAHRAATFTAVTLSGATVQPPRRVPTRAYADSARDSARIGRAPSRAPRMVRRRRRRLLNLDALLGANLGRRSRGGLCSADGRGTQTSAAATWRRARGGGKGARADGGTRRCSGRTRTLHVRRARSPSARLSTWTVRASHSVHVGYARE